MHILSDTFPLFFELYFTFIWTNIDIATHCFSIIFAVSRVAGCRFTRIIDIPIDHRSIVKIRLFLYDTNYTLFNVTTKPQCVDCILFCADIRQCEWRVRDDSTTSKMWKKKKRLPFNIHIFKNSYANPYQKYFIKKEEYMSLGTTRALAYIPYWKQI